ncbi:MFS transporter [Yinghuangia seranimata]|uniref:MFS transporter n=1 Tax=Yinghuangia seranimata TaxID=408067 RepID=UPI00248B5F53|nr:MFS transporter [Yinghuangia seranimata]MDI2129981.1 MFS transporter [Yinghuangia seranimata]
MSDSPSPSGDTGERDPGLAAASATAVAAAPAPSPLSRLWNRQLDRYPETLPRVFYLFVSTLAGIVLYYELYVQYSVSTTLIRDFNQTYMFATMISVVGNLAGAFASLIAGLADRWGRANLVVYGLLVVGLLIVFAVPNAHSKYQLMAYMAIVSFVEGLVLVASPALIRDFSPQVGRAAAMGFWTLGPVIGSLVTTLVTSHTLDDTSWQTEFRYAGYAGLAVFLVAFIGLRELSPALRDQLMVDLRDRALVEAKARGLKTEDLLKGQWRQMMRLDIIGPSIGIGLHLMFYYSVVGNLVVYYGTVFNYSEQRTNALANWYWVANALALVAVGIASDVLKVRKPFMIFGGVGTVVFTLLFLMKTDQPETSYHTFAWLLVGIGVCSGFTFAPWMAAFTETIERHNPAATATGLAVWGWTLRVIVSVSAIFTPLIVTSVTPLVNKADAGQAAFERSGDAAAVVQANPELFAELNKYPDPMKAPPELLNKAITTIGEYGAKNNMPNLLQKFLDPATQNDLRLLDDLQNTAERAPDEWKRWWWFTIACQAAFLPTVFIMAGRWNPKKAKQDADEHAQRVAAELAELEAAEAAEATA